MKNRAGGFLIKDKKILLIHQIFKGETFYTIPGGSIEEGETKEQTVVREFEEETGFKVKPVKHLFTIEDDRVADYYMMEYISGSLVLGGPEKERMSEDDQYYLEWIDLEEISKLFFHPHQMGSMIKKYGN